MVTNFNMDFVDWNKVEEKMDERRKINQMDAKTAAAKSKEAKHKLRAQELDNIHKQIADATALGKNEITFNIKHKSSVAPLHQLGFKVTFTDSQNESTQAKISWKHLMVD